MARGWESKSIESQMDDAQAARRRVNPVPVERARIAAEISSVHLSRTRILQQLESSTSARYTEQQRKALAHLDEMIATLEAKLR